ncbi:hypothetical protein BT93_H1816 [Corymbia citriodora subsp. variegata]|nr:hypothetical protein BT93_H1816 [Corymbia citriodora subsp. variegata]
MVETTLKHLWGHHLREVKVNDQGFYFFRIIDHEFRRKVVEGDPLTVARVPLILQQWHPMLELKKGIHSSVPVWIRLKNLPYVLWSALGLSAIASLVGKPLYIDQRTEQLKMISFARVCVELTAAKDCCDSLKVVLNGETRIVEVEYEWKPVSCKSCGTFGHKCPSPVQEAHQNHLDVSQVTLESSVANIPTGVAAEVAVELTVAAVTVRSPVVVAAEVAAQIPPHEARTPAKSVAVLPDSSPPPPARAAAVMPAGQGSTEVVWTPIVPAIAVTEQGPLHAAESTGADASLVAGVEVDSDLSPPPLLRIEVPAAKEDWQQVRGCKREAVRSSIMRPVR